MKAKICHLEVPSCTSSVSLLSYFHHPSLAMKNTHTHQGCPGKVSCTPAPFRAAALSSLPWAGNGIFHSLAFSDFTAVNVDLHRAREQVLKQNSPSPCSMWFITEQGLPAEPGLPQSNRKWDTDPASGLKPQEKGITKKTHHGSQGQVELFRKVIFTLLCPVPSPELPQSHPQWTQTWARPPSHHSDLAAGSYQEILWLKRS